MGRIHVGRQLHILAAKKKESGMYDVIVVGARCGGAPAAMLLARDGYRVLLIDRSMFPGDSLLGHYIHQPGVSSLRRWGLFDRVIASGCPPITRQIFDLGDVQLIGNPPPSDGSTEALCVRRSVLEKILIDAAVEAGAELREAFTVTQVLQKRGRIVGLTGRTREGEQITVTASLVIGADGANSFIAQSVEASFITQTPPLTCSYFGYFTGVPVCGVELYPRDGCFIIACPTNDDMTVVHILWPRGDLEIRKRDPEGNFLRALTLTPQLRQRVVAGRRVSRFYGGGAAPSFIRKPFGAGWALIGDAGCHKDPITAQGMTDAFRDAELIATAIDSAFSGKSEMNDAMSAFESARNIAVMPTYEHTIELARLRPPSEEMRRIVTGVAASPVQTNRFFGTVAGTTPLRDFFSEENIARLIGRRKQAPLNAA